MPLVRVVKPAFTIAATSRGGRQGHVRSEDGVLDLDLAMPGTTSEARATPETLFAAGYAACFAGALANRAKTRGVDATDAEVTARVTFGGTDDDGFGIGVELQVHIPGLDEERAGELVELAHQFCPYSKATRDNIVVTLAVV